MENIIIKLNDIQNDIIKLTVGELAVKLTRMPGCKKYHQEGNSWIHTLKVVHHVSELIFEIYGKKLSTNELVDLNAVMSLVAYLHDVGKIYTGQLGMSTHDFDGNGNPVRDWIYPDHALVGSIRGILMQYISDKSSYFTTVQWFIKNHIKLMYCYGKQLDELQYLVGNNPPSQYCTISNLAILTISDLLGSECRDDQDISMKLTKIEWLRNLIKVELENI